MSVGLSPPLTCRSANARELDEAGGFAALEILQKLVENAKGSIAEEKGDDRLGKEIGHCSVKHATDRGDTVMELPSALIAGTKLTMPDRSRLPVRTKSPLRAEV